jgi:hypothetical protein
MPKRCRIKKKERESFWKTFFPFQNVSVLGPERMFFQCCVGKGRKLLVCQALGGKKIKIMPFY